jgi:hypothetical protein
VRKAIFGLGFFLLVACSGSSKPGTSDLESAAASGGEDARGGSSSQGGSGSSATGGNTTGGGTSTGGAATGGASSGGSYRGGSDQGGTTSEGGLGGEGTGESGGTSGSSGTSSATGGMATAGKSGAGGTTGGTNGGGSGTDAVCDPADGALDDTLYPNCEPRDASDPCELCIESSCCEESKVCYGYDPGNVCGWGGPTSGAYSGMSEFDCYVLCVRNYVDEFGAYDESADDLCVPACTTPGCGLIGNATQDLVVCLDENCNDECFGP